MDCCSAVEALERYAPQFVLVSWMELGQDWSRDIRACASVTECAAPSPHPARAAEPRGPALGSAPSMARREPAFVRAL